jgi:cell division protein FtsN
MEEGMSMRLIMALGLASKISDRNSSYKSIVVLYPFKFKYAARRARTRTS